MFLGKDEFISMHRDPAENPEKLREISKAHKKSIALSLFDYQNHYPQRNEAMARAYLSGAYTMAEIGLYLRFIIWRLAEQLESMNVSNVGMLELPPFLQTSFRKNSDSPLAKFMQSMANRYVRYFNAKHQRSRTI